MRFSLNGQVLEKAYEGFGISFGMIPACSLCTSKIPQKHPQLTSSLASGMKANFHLTRSQLKYLPKGYKAVAESRDRVLHWTTFYSHFCSLVNSLVSREAVPTSLWQSALERFSKNLAGDSKILTSIDWSHWTLAMDEQLAEFSQTKENQPFSVLSNLNEMSTELEKFQLIKSEPINHIRLRLMILLLFNDYVRPLIKLVNLELVDKPWSLAHKLSILRGIFLLFIFNFINVFNINYYFYYFLLKILFIVFILFFLIFCYFFIILKFIFLFS